MKSIKPGASVPHFLPSVLCGFFCLFFYSKTAIKFRFTNDSVNTTERKNKAKISEPLSVKIIAALLPTWITTNCLFVLHARAVIFRQ